MKVTRDLLFEEAGDAGIPPEQIDELWDGLSAAAARQRKYAPLQVAYYFGASIVIAAVTYFFAPGLGAGWRLRHSRHGADLRQLSSACWACICIAPRPGGLGRLAHSPSPSAMTPVAAYGLESALGWWPPVAPGGSHVVQALARNNWLIMELATVAASGLALRCLRLPFLMTPAVVALWYLAIDLGPRTQQCWASVGFGLGSRIRGLPGGQTNSTGLRLLALPVRPGGLLGRAFVHGYRRPWSRLWYFLVNVAADRALHRAGPPCLCGVRFSRRGGLPELPDVPSLPRLRCSCPWRGPSSAWASSWARWPGSAIAAASTNFWPACSRGNWPASSTASARQRADLLLDHVRSQNQEQRLLRTLQAGAAHHHLLADLHVHVLVDSGVDVLHACGRLPSRSSDRPWFCCRGCAVRHACGRCAPWCRRHSPRHCGWRTWTSWAASRRSECRRCPLTIRPGCAGRARPASCSP